MPASTVGTAENVGGLADRTIDLLDIAAKGGLCARSVAAILSLVDFLNDLGKPCRDASSSSLGVLAHGDELCLLLALVTHDFGSKVANEVGQLGASDQICHVLSCDARHGVVQRLVAAGAEGLFGSDHEGLGIPVVLERLLDLLGSEVAEGLDAVVVGDGIHTHMKHGAWGVLISGQRT